MHLIRLDSAISPTGESLAAGCHTVEAPGHAARPDERPCGAFLSAAKRAFDRGCLLASSLAADDPREACSSPPTRHRTRRARRLGQGAGQDQRRHRTPALRIVPRHPIPANDSLKVIQWAPVQSIPATTAVSASPAREDPISRAHNAEARSVSGSTIAALGSRLYLEEFWWEGQRRYQRGQIDDFDVDRVGICEFGDGETGRRTESGTAPASVDS